MVAFKFTNRTVLTVTRMSLLHPVVDSVVTTAAIFRVLATFVCLCRALSLPRSSLVHINSTVVVAIFVFCTLGFFVGWKVYNYGIVSFGVLLVLSVFLFVPLDVVASVS